MHVYSEENLTKFHGIQLKKKLLENYKEISCSFLGNNANGIYIALLSGIYSYIIMQKRVS